MKISKFKKTGLLIMALLLIFISIFYFQDQKNKKNKVKHTPALVNQELNVLMQLKNEEKKAIPVFYKHYVSISQNYELLRANLLSTSEFLRRIKIISVPLTIQFNKSEDIRLGYRFKFSDKMLQSKEYNNLYTDSYQPRWHLKSFISSLSTKDNITTAQIGSIYEEEIEKGFKKAFPNLVISLNIDPAKYPITNPIEEIKAATTNTLPDEKSLRESINLELMKHKWRVEDLQLILQEDRTFFIALTVKVKGGNESELSLLSKEVYGRFFTEIPIVSFLSINILTDEEKSLLTGIEKSKFMTFMKENKQTDLKVMADLYSFTQ